jgi:hypothetical protein
MFRKSLLAAAAAASLLGFGSAAYAQVYVQVAPPAMRAEVAPAPRAGSVWVPGHYEWRNNDYVWISGYWVAERPGYAYVEPRWVQRANGQWYMVGNNWERRGPNGDRDGDGVANRYDRDRDGDGIPNQYDNRGRRNRMGPYGDLDRDGIQNRHDRDIDGDGIRNGRDSEPYNWRRS